MIGDFRMLFESVLNKNMPIFVGHIRRGIFSSLKGGP